MMDHQDIGDNHNAPVFARCYKRMGEFIGQLPGEGRQPRVMLDYPGTSLHGMRQMSLDDVFDALGYLTGDPRARQAVEWLGGTWGHAVAPSTPPKDFRLHVRAWQHHFAAIFGLEALGRVRGLSPAEMALPNHPDGARAFVRTLADCGYQGVLVQEHTAEQPDGRSICRTGWCAQTRAGAGAPAPGAGTIPAREGPGRLAAVIGERIRPVQRGRRQLDRGSWTNDVSWVRGVRERAGTDAAR